MLLLVVVHVERKVPKYENHNLRERKVKTYDELKRSRKGQAHTNTRKLNRDISTGTAVFRNRKKRVNVCERTTKGGKLSEINARTESRR